MNSQAPASRDAEAANRQPSAHSSRLARGLSRHTKPGDAWRDLSLGWTALSYLIAGIVFWGGLGLLLDKVFNTRPVLTVIGVLVGNFAGVYLVYLRTMGGKNAS